MVQQFHSWVLSPKNEKCQLLSRDRVFAIPRIVAYQALLFMEFSRQEYWSGLPLPSPGDLPNPGVESVSSALAGMFFTTEPPGKVKESELLYGVRPGHLRQMWSQGFSWLCEFLQVHFSVSLPMPFSFLHQKQ